MVRQRQRLAEEEVMHQRQRPMEYLVHQGQLRAPASGHPPQSSQQDQNTGVIQDLVNLLLEEVKLSHLPTLEPETLRGDITKFELWLKAFETYIRSSEFDAPLQTHSIWRRRRRQGTTVSSRGAAPFWRTWRTRPSRLHIPELYYTSGTSIWLAL